jgi:hypothetical protein
MVKRMNFDDGVIPEFEFMFKGENYVATEASSTAVVKYQNAAIGVTDLDDEGKPKSVQVNADCELILMAEATFKVTKDGNREPVPAALIRLWPHRVTEAVIEFIKETSNLGVAKDIVAIDKQIASLQKKRAKLVQQETERKNA